MLKKKKASGKFTAKAKRLFFRPNPRIEFAHKSMNQMTSSMDSSDGLSTCLNELSRQGKKKFVITELPTNDDIVEFSNKNKINLKDLIFNGGEEFELVFTVAQKDLTKIHNIAKRLKIHVFEIGHVIKGNGVFFEDKKESFRIKDKGWRHFR